MAVVVDGQNLPSGQTVQNWAFPIEYVPGAQSLLGICCVDGHSIPTGQSVQFKLPTSAYWPGSQGTGYASVVGHL